MRENKNLTYLVHGAVIAALYVVLTLNFLPISYGPIQFRISEALCILPYLPRRRFRVCLRAACCLT